MDRIVPRLQVFEIDDQPWFPAFLRARVQAVLTGFWNTRLPPLQAAAPASLIADTLRDVLGDARMRRYTVVDFCAGAGGPTPAIERALNAGLAAAAAASRGRGAGVDGGYDENDENYGVDGDCDRHDKNDDDDDNGVDFVMTDIAPHAAAWRRAAAGRRHLHYVPTPVDAAAAPADLLARAGLVQGGWSSGADADGGGAEGQGQGRGEARAWKRRDTGQDSEAKARKILRTFHLAFHHFDDAAATRILQDSLATADAVAIVELVERSFSSLLLNVLLAIPTAALTPLLFWRDPLHLLFTYALPIVPLVMVFDGLMSSLRIRRADEVLALVERAHAANRSTASEWEWSHGRRWHTWPLGVMSYVVGWRRGR